MAILIRGAGDIATGIALRLYRAGFQIVMTDLPQPTSIRRTVCFSEALRLGEMLVEDVCARRAGTAQEALDISAAGDIAVLADPECALLPQLHPAALVDAILAKHNLGTHRTWLRWLLPWVPASPLGRIATPPWRPCEATPWGGLSTAARQSQIPAFPASSAVTAPSG